MAQRPDEGADVLVVDAEARAGGKANGEVSIRAGPQGGRRQVLCDGAVFSDAPMAHRPTLRDLLGFEAAGGTVEDGPVGTLTGQQSIISFRKLGRSDFPLLQKWLAAPHVAVWWNERFDLASLEERRAISAAEGSRNAQACGMRLSIAVR